MEYLKPRYHSRYCGKSLKKPLFQDVCTYILSFFVCFRIKPATKTATILNLYFAFHLSLRGGFSQCVVGFQCYYFLGQIQAIVLNDFVKISSIIPFKDLGKNKCNCTGYLIYCCNFCHGMFSHSNNVDFKKELCRSG